MVSWSLYICGIPVGGEGEGEGEGEPDEQVTGELGGLVFLELPVEYDFVSGQWYKRPDLSTPLENGGRIAGVQTRELCIYGLVLDDAGVYTLVYEDDAKAIMQYHIELVVEEELPVSGAAALAALTAAAAGLGGLRLRRRRRNDLTSGYRW